MKKEKKVISAPSVTSLNRRIAELSAQGWEPIGTHQVVTTHAQNTYAGTQHRTTQFTTEYSMTLQKSVDTNKVGEILERVAKKLDEVQNWMDELGSNDSLMYQKLYDARCEIEDAKEDLGVTTE